MQMLCCDCYWLCLSVHVSFMKQSAQHTNPLNVKLWYDMWYLRDCRWIKYYQTQIYIFPLLQILLLGAEEGLFSYRLKETNAKPVRIEGLTHVHQMSMLPLLNCLIVLAGMWALVKHGVDFARICSIHITVYSRI